MWKIVLLMAAVLLTSCKTPKPKPLSEVSDQNINISFNINSMVVMNNPNSGTLTINLIMRDDEAKYIEVGQKDQIHVFLNGTEYQLIKFYCSDLYGPQYFCGYGFPVLSAEEIAKLVQPLDISLQMQKNKGQLITAKVSLPRFLTMHSSIPVEQKYNPLTDLVQITWTPSVPLKHIIYSAGKYEHSVCFVSKTTFPQQGDTYIQYAANEFSLDATVCNPMSYAVVTAAVESTVAMQTNVTLASASIQLSQTTSLTLLSEPFNP